jgi:hypothetical protein
MVAVFPVRNRPRLRGPVVDPAVNRLMTINGAIQFPV